MIPLNLGFQALKFGFNAWRQRKADMSQKKHEVALAELETVKERSKRKWSLVADIILIIPVLMIFVTPLVAAFHPTAYWLDASEKINVFYNNIDYNLWIMIYIVYGGNFGVSFANIINGNKKLKK